MAYNGNKGVFLFLFREFLFLDKGSFYASSLLTFVCSFKSISDGEHQFTYSMWRSFWESEMKINTFAWVMYKWKGTETYGCFNAMQCVSRKGLHASASPKKSRCVTAFAKTMKRVVLFHRKYFHGFYVAYKQTITNISMKKYFWEFGILNTRFFKINLSCQGSHLNRTQSKSHYSENWVKNNGCSRNNDLEIHTACKVRTRRTLLKV